jgi:hypothetical protein
MRAKGKTQNTPKDGVMEMKTCKSSKAAKHSKKTSEMMRKGNKENIPRSNQKQADK